MYHSDPALWGEPPANMDVSLLSGIRHGGWPLSSVHSILEPPSFKGGLFWKNVQSPHQTSLIENIWLFFFFVLISWKYFPMTETPHNNLAERIEGCRVWPFQATIEFLRSYINPGQCTIDPRLWERIQQTQDVVCGLVTPHESASETSTKK